VFSDERLQVLDLALHGVRRSVAAFAPATSSVVVDREVLGQLRDERRILRAVVDRSAHQDHGWSPSVVLVRDRRAVLRRHTVHPSLLCVERVITIDETITGVVLARRS
jgi:hypothetical protein